MIHLIQKKIYKKLLICFFSFASILTTCHSRSFKREDKKSSSTSQRNFNKKVVGIFCITLGILGGCVLYNSSPPQSNKTKAPLNPNSFPNNQNKTPINTSSPNFPWEIQEAVDNASEQSSDSEFYSEEEKEAEPRVYNTSQQSEESEEIDIQQILNNAPQDDNSSCSEDNEFLSSTNNKNELIAEDQQKELEHWSKHKQNEVNNNTQKNEDLAKIQLFNKHDLQAQAKALKRFEEEKQLKQEKNEQLCCICQAGFDDKDEYKKDDNKVLRESIQAPCCVAVFHRECLQSMRKQNTQKCPICSQTEVTNNSIGTVSWEDFLAQLDN